MAVYSSKVMNESAAVVTEAVNPLQYAIDIQRDDLQLFNAVIEADFAEVYSEAGLTTLTESDITSLLEAEGNKFKQKIDEVIEKVKVVINNLITKFIATIDNLFKNDEKIVAKYSKYVTKEKCAGCPVKQETINEEAYTAFVSKLTGMITRAETEALNNATKETIEGNSKTLKELVETDSSKVIKAAGEEKLADVVDFAAMTGSVSGDGKKAKNDALAFRTKANGVMASAKSKAKSNLSPDKANADLNEIYTGIVSLSNLVSKACTLYVKFAGKRVAIYRKNYITLGAWVLRNEGKAAAEEAPKADTKPVEKIEGEVVDKDGNPVGEATAEDIYAMLLAEASDMYTEELFSLVY